MTATQGLIAAFALLGLAIYVISGRFIKAKKPRIILAVILSLVGAIAFAVLIT